MPDPFATNCPNQLFQRAFKVWHANTHPQEPISSKSNTNDATEMMRLGLYAIETYLPTAKQISCGKSIYFIVQTLSCSQLKWLYAKSGGFTDVFIKGDNWRRAGHVFCTPMVTVNMNGLNIEGWPRFH